MIPTAELAPAARNRIHASEPCRVRPFEHTAIGSSTALSTGGARAKLGIVPPITDTSRFIGRAPERLGAGEWRQVSGLWAAFEIYTPETTPLRRIEALGRSAAECMNALAARDLDPRKYEYIPLRNPLPR